MPARPTTPKAGKPTRKPRRTVAPVIPNVPGRQLLESWFATRGWVPWPFQRAAWDSHANGQGGLIEVPTGAGKTYAAFGGALIELIDKYRAKAGAETTDFTDDTDEEKTGDGRHAPSSQASAPQLHSSRCIPHSAFSSVKSVKSVVAPSGLAILYLTPLRAVARDIEAALKAPITDLNLPFIAEGRTGDTPSSVRLRQKDRLPHILITTPESLSLLLTRPDAPTLFATLRTTIVDEWHELLPSKRGSQIELALARLRAFSPRARTWALSATLPNLDEARAAALGFDAHGHPNPGTIVRGGMRRDTIVDSILPSHPSHLPWAGHLGLTMLPDVLASLDPATPTIVFTNTRSQAERWYHAILYNKPEWAGTLALHHGSLDRDERERVEAGLKSGSLRIVVATSSLDLGVDFAPVERVLQIGSPKGIARVAQRAGRAAHRPMTPCRITCVPTHALELIEIDAARSALAAGELEPRAGHDKPLDVLAQHLVTCALGGGFDPDALFREVRTAHAFRDLSREEFDWALTIVTHGGALHAYPDFRRVSSSPDGRLGVPDRRIAQLHRMNIGTIVSDSAIEIRYVRGRSLGRIEESFVANLREGQKFVFAGKVLAFAGLKDAVAYARPARGTANHTPIWSGTRLPISESLAAAIRTSLASTRADSPELTAAAPLLAAQRRLSLIPQPHELLAEIHATREGTHLFLFPFEGRSVHAGLAALLALRLTRLRESTLTTAIDDYGLEILGPRDFPYADLLTPALFSADALAEDTAASVNMSQLAKLQFREVARVAGLVQENYPGARKSGRQSRASSSLLFDVLTEFDSGNMLLHQARREVLERHFEHSRLARTLARLRESTLRITTPARLTPLAFPLLIERQSATLSSQTIAQRLNDMRQQWST